MNGFIGRNIFRFLILGMAVGMTACSDVAFSPEAANPNQALEIPPGSLLESFGFNNQDTQAKVDILFVVDNSGSMLDEQTKLAPALSSFINSLARIDWQIGITTTDISNGPYGLKGSLVPFKGTSTKILTKKVAGYETAFAGTVVRDELIACDGDPNTCPSSDERPLEAITLAIAKRSSNNAGFFRNGADLATVILSDEDEGSVGSGVTGSMVATAVAAAFGDKTYTSFGIVIRPGDTACFNSQTTSEGKYGTFAAGLALLTQGLLGSICDADYGPTLASIGQRVVEQVKTITLKQRPDPDTIQLRVTPADPGLYITKVDGKIITFNKPPAQGTKIDVIYTAK